MDVAVYERAMTVACNFLNTTFLRIGERSEITLFSRKTPTFQLKSEAYTVYNTYTRARASRLKENIVACLLRMRGLTMPHCLCDL